MTEYIEREQLIWELKDVIAVYKDEHTFSTDFAATIVTDILDNIVKCQPAADVAPVGRCHGGGERGMSWITKDEFLDEICKRCTVDQRVKTGILTEDEAREECDCCSCIMIAGMICDAAGIE